MSTKKGRTVGRRRKTVVTGPSTAQPVSEPVEPVAEMFSPATFYDVIMSEPGAAAGPAGEPMEALGRSSVVAFYGFRGGAGRTLALAHSGVMLARQGAKIVAIDLDLEAPGLHVALEVSVPEDVRGSAALLRAAATTPPDTPLRVVDNLVPAPAAEGPGRLLLLPAGRVSQKYLAEIEELGVGLWHAHQPPTPLNRILNELRRQEDPDAILIDCRTGFNGLSASVLFHIADLAVVFFPLSGQVWDGLRVVLEAARAAKRQRNNRPALLLVPSMVPPGDVARLLLQDGLKRLHDLYVECVGPIPVDPDAEDPDQPPQPWLAEGVRYDVAIASTGRVAGSLQPTAWGVYQPLADTITRSLGLTVAPLTSDGVDARAVLGELVVDRQLAFAENPDFARLARNFVAPADLVAALDRATTLVVGAKGAGKTWLWRYLVNSGAGGTYRLPEGMRFVVGHGPNSPEAGDLQISADGFKELERSARMQHKGTYRAFWLLYGLARLASWRRELGQVIEAQARGEERKRVDRLLAATSSRALLTALERLLLGEGIGTLAEAMTRSVDRSLLLGEDAVTLVYDGLDTGFEVPGTGERWVDRRERFVAALLQVMADARSQQRRLFHKVFLREDIYLSIEIQNKSHLEAAKFELRWRSIDLWKIALNVVSTSETYKAAMRSLRPGIEPPWPGDEQTLKALLAPFWGETIERGKKAKTANYVEKRTSDAADRLFPRTLVQVLDEAIQQERESSDPPAATSGRVIRFASLRKGIARASRQRVDDLVKEYAELGPYLRALKGMEVTGTAAEFIQHMRRAFAATSDKRRSLVAALHAGQGGWQKVVDRLVAVGVLGPYRRGVAEGDEPRLAVALLYRGGLGVKQAGLA